MEVRACRLRAGDRVVVEHERRTVLATSEPDPGVTEVRLLTDPEAARPVTSRFFENQTPIECIYRVCACGTRVVDPSGSCGCPESSEG